MTSVDEKIFQLDDPNYISYNRRKQDYLRISSTTGAANNLNQGGNVVSFEVNNHANFLYLPQSFIYCEFHIANQAGTAVPGNITLEHNWFPQCFDEMRLEIGSQQLEIISEPGEFDTMLKFLTRGKDYSDANIEGWIPDTGTGNSVADITPIAADANDAAQLAGLRAAVSRLNVHNLNEGYLKRKTVYNNANGVANRQGGWIKWPLNPLFGYLDHNKVTVNLPIKFSLKRRANDQNVFFGVDGTNARLEITKLEFWIPNIQPSLEIEAAITKRLNTNKDIAINLLKRNTFTNTIIQQEQTWHIASISNTPRFLFVMFKPTNLNQAFDVNNSCFPSHVPVGEGVTNAVQITSLQVKLNQARYPLDAVIQNPQNFNVFEAYIQYESMCKVFGIEPPLNPIDFKKLYTLYCFDLSAQDENLVKNGVNIQLAIKKSSAEPLSAYCLILEDASHIIKVLNGQMTRIE
jgi:hypothetical protein